MSELTTGTNPKIITWARMRIGLSIPQLATRLKLHPDQIMSWESGDSSPSYTILEKLAYSIFHIPVAVFYFPEPPHIEDPIQKFRRLPEFEFERLSPETLHLVRLAGAFQESLAELTLVPPVKKIFKDLTPNDVHVGELAAKARAYLGITVQEQFDFTSMQTAFKAWRHALEISGIYTFKDSIPDKFISGFCLLDENFPIIFINNSNSFSRQIFTIIHELGHILFHVNGVTDINEHYLMHMSETEREIEINCNAFAASVLVPNDIFEITVPRHQKYDELSVSAIADKFSVSREVIWRKLLDNKYIDYETFNEEVAKLRIEYLRPENQRKGGDYYSTNLAYLGEGFSKLAFYNYQAGKITKVQLAQHLNINSKNLDRLESYLFK
jgi:Zn-dependent peptidase ImmA (M78 family)/transcriptional regulator with XRE-family HTH domain